MTNRPLPVPETYFRENGLSGEQTVPEHVVDPLNEHYEGGVELLGPNGIGALFPSELSQTYKK